ncbi:MAG: hypothetical protein ACKPKO_42950, partial [Candidatus Fonsibacter sp.]
MRDMSRVNGGVDDLVEKDPVQRQWQDVKTLVEAKSVEANAQEKTECDPVRAHEDNNNDGSSGYSEASTTTTLKNQERFLDNLAIENVRAYVMLLPEPT